MQPSWIRKLQQQQNGAQQKHQKGNEPKHDNKEKGKQELKKKAQSHVTKKKSALVKGTGTKTVTNAKEAKEKERSTEEKAADGKSFYVIFF